MPALAPAERVVGINRRGLAGRPSLHQKIKGRNGGSNGADLPSSDSPDPNASGEKSVDTDAEPLSSSEEDELANRTSPPKSLSRQPPETQWAEPAIDLSPSKSRGSKRKAATRTLRDTDHACQATVSTSGPLRNDLFDDFGSSQSQDRLKRKKMNVYTSSQKRGFNVIPALPVAHQDALNTAEFNVPHAIPQPSKQLETRTKRHLILKDAPKNLNTGSLPITSLQLPDLPKGLCSSSMTTGTEISPSFDMDDLTADHKYYDRSGSVSSLSSTDSGASLMLTQEQKSALEDNEDTVYCPICRSRVERSLFEELNRGRRMNIRAQQRFCREHKEREAKSLSDQRGYPDIDWEDLKSRRISHHIPHLRSVLQGNAPSYYLTRLEEVVNQPRRGKLTRYLGQDIVDVVKYGYYGPRAARHIAPYVSQAMSKALSEALRRDKTVKAADVGGYVSAVLVPELLVQLVMEDMKITDPGRAREILDESNELGIALNHDDDERISRKGDD